MMATATARPRFSRDFILIALLLAVIAALAPAPWYETDRDTYVQIGREYIVPDCSSLHCTRILVSWVVETLPGPSLVKWKAYAVLANAGAGVAVMAFAAALGFSSRSATLAGWISALGFGSLFTIFDPHTSDPLMYLFGPLLSTLLVRGRLRAAGWLAGLGILAKEFAAAPLWIFAIAEALAARWIIAVRAVVLAALVTLAWIALQLWLMLGFNYGYGDSASADVFGGGYLRLWASYVSPRVAAATIFGEFGALFLLIPFGFLRAGPDLRRLAIASIPAVAALAYVQQPDRALWNFHYLAVPLAVLMLERVPTTISWLFVAFFGLANLRLGAQIAWVPSARFGLVVTLGIALFAIVSGLRARWPAARAQVSVW